MPGDSLIKAAQEQKENQIFKARKQRYHEKKVAINSLQCFIYRMFRS